jgi:hypothetical protein
VDHYGYEIDPHQESGWAEGVASLPSSSAGADNYADVRFFYDSLVVV